MEQILIVTGRISKSVSLIQGTENQPSMPSLTEVPVVCFSDYALGESL